MSAEILSTAVDDDVRTERERALQIRRKECIVNDDELVMLFSYLRYCFDVCNRK